VAAERERDRHDAALKKLRRASHLWRIDYQKETAKRFQQLLAEVCLCVLCPCTVRSDADLACSSRPRRSGHRKRERSSACATKSSAPWRT
jgi:hypothetical protein